MNVHKNARLTPYRREELVTRAGRGEPVAGLARQLGISLRTARKWLARHRAEGLSGLQDRSSRPHCSPPATAPASGNGDGRYPSSAAWCSDSAIAAQPFWSANAAMSIAAR